MTYKEACAILNEKNPEIKAVSCVEYETLYVFQILPLTYDSDKPLKKAFNDTVSVNKKTKEVRDFKPFHISISEYKLGTKVGEYT